MAGCLVSDVRMPAMSGLELQLRLIERRIFIPMVFITAHGDTAMAVAALKRGAVDFLEKPVTREALLRSVKEAFAQDSRRRLIEDERGVVSARHARLSERELSVMSMVIADWSNKEIARALDISPRTVDHHREHIMAKMEAKSLSELIVMGLITGLKELRLQTGPGAGSST
jgi:FixJ family two-component response regulator